MSGLLRRLSARFRALPIPFRSTKLIGTDLQGNLFFESPSTREGFNAKRRHVEFTDGRDPYADYTQDGISPQWNAWLRHTRSSAPTLEELKADLVRQDQVRLNAALLEAKYKQEGTPLLNIDLEKLEAISNPRKLVLPGKSFQPESWLPKK